MLHSAGRGRSRAGKYEKYELRGTYGTTLPLAPRSGVRLGNVVSALVRGIDPHPHDGTRGGVAEPLVWLLHMYGYEVFG